MRLGLRKYQKAGESKNSSRGPDLTLTVAHLRERQEQRAKAALPLLSAREITEEFVKFPMERHYERATMLVANINRKVAAGCGGNPKGEKVNAKLHLVPVPGNLRTVCPLCRRTVRAKSNREHPDQTLLTLALAKHMVSAHSRKTTVKD